jgi:hypothetical protein
MPPREGKIDDVKYSFYEELERVFNKFPKYRMKILLGDFNAKVGICAFTVILKTQYRDSFGTDRKRFKTSNS